MTVATVDGELNAGIGHAMMSQLAGDIRFDHFTRHCSDAAQAVVALKRFGHAALDLVLQTPLYGANQVLGRDVRLGADEELAGTAASDAMLEDAHTIRLCGLLQRAQPVAVRNGGLAPEQR